MRPAKWVAAIGVGYAAAALVPVVARPAGIDRSSYSVAGASAEGSAATSAASTEPPPIRPTVTTQPVRREISIAVAGDILLHSPVSTAAAAYGRESGSAYDYRPMFDRVRATLSAADLALCHLETPLSPDDASLSTYPSFSVPWEIAPALADAGFDGCSTASNHSLDRGAAGVTATLDHLDFAGLGHSGSARSAQESATPSMYDVRGVQVGHLAYTDHLNGASVPADQPWLVSRIDSAKMLSDASALRAAGAEIVVVSLHWGSEFVSDPTDSQAAIAAALLASPDVDLVVGHHAHVVQPVEEIDGEWVAYGLGNFLSNQYDTTCCPAESQDGVIMIFHFREAEGGAFSPEAVEAVPTWVERPTYRIMVATDALSDPAIAPSTRDSLARSLERTLEVLGRRGAAPAVAAAAR